MEYGKIIAVTGLPGLFELLNSKNDGAIVRSLDDKTTKFVSSRVHNFSHLESIEVFTVRDNVNLVDIFHAMEKEGGNVPDGKDAAVLKKYFEKVYGDLDFERVYVSDLKKMTKWYEILKNNNIEIKLTEVPEEESEAEQPVEETQVDNKKKTAAKAENAGAAEKKEAAANKLGDDKAGVKTKSEEGKAVAKKKTESKDDESDEAGSSPKEASKKAAPKKSAAAKSPAEKTAPKKKS